MLTIIYFQGLVYDGPFEFQYKVKFKEDGWPIGFEGGPL